MPLGPAQQYIVTYNGQQLPGYAQSEDDPINMNVVDHYGFGWDGSLSQIAGLNNKTFRMDFKVWEATYRACKDQYHKATSILLSKRDGFAPLYVDYTDRYFNAATRNITYNQTVAQSRRLLTYSVEWDCLPWQTGTSVHTLNGTGGTIVTTGRDFDDGGWTPVHLTVTGTNITISGYTATERLTGFASIDGSVSSFIIDTENSTTSDDSKMLWKDYGLWVGPGETSWATTGMSSYTLTYYDRWY